VQLGKYYISMAEILYDRQTLNVQLFTAWFQTLVNFDI